MMSRQRGNGGAEHEGRGDESRGKKVKRMVGLSVITSKGRERRPPLRHVWAGMVGGENRVSGGNNR